MELVSPAVPSPWRRVPRSSFSLPGDFAFFGLAFMPVSSATWFQWSEVCRGSWKGSRRGPRGSLVLEAIYPAPAGPSVTLMLLTPPPVSVSSPVGPPALLPAYFQWYIFYFVIKRKKWVVSIHGPQTPCTLGGMIRAQWATCLLAP